MHVYLFFLSFLSYFVLVSFLNNDLCFDIFEREKKRIFFFKSSKDIIVVTISVHSNRSEIQKAGGGAEEKIKWWNTQR